MNFIPATQEEVRERGWTELDIVLISGDAYVDHPSFGVAVIARVLEKAGFRVAIIAQPDITTADSITIFGRPRLFFGVTGGNVDSMLARYTAFKKVRNDDPFSADGKEGLRPDRAVVRYCNLIKQVYKETPIIVGGVEASMRRFAHYDFWSDRVRRSIIEDSRAELLVYGMGEKAIVEAATRLSRGEQLSGIAGTMEITRQKPSEALFLPAEEEVIQNKNVFNKAFAQIYLNQDSVLVQPAGKRYLVQYPGQEYTTEDLDAIYGLPYVRKPHPQYEGKRIPAFEMIHCSITAHRGCASGCAFCSIALHQGRKIISRSQASVVKEVALLASLPSFKGHITDIGGPSANMYAATCKRGWKCRRDSCLYPKLCPHFSIHTGAWLQLLKKASRVKNVKHVTVGSGIRYDLFMRDNPSLLEQLVRYHVSGQLKIAPEHLSENVLHRMRKRPIFPLEKFVALFKAACKKAGRRYYLVPYFMSNHPGCRYEDMQEMKRQITKVFSGVPEQVQSFIPLPMTLSAAIYYTGKDPLTGETVFSEKEYHKCLRQHQVFLRKKKS